MNILIVYASKTGATQECAEYLVKQLPQATMWDLKKAAPDISHYDCIIIGSGVRIGNFYKPVKTFLAKNEAVLATKKIAIYFCNRETETVAAIIQKNIPDALKAAAFYIQTLGGKPPFKKDVPQDSWMHYENIANLIEAVKNNGFS